MILGNYANDKTTTGMGIFQRQIRLALHIVLTDNDHPQRQGSSSFSSC